MTEGHGLASQETRCREYAKHKGYDIIDVFRDEGLSGKLLDRPNMKAMLDYQDTKLLMGVILSPDGHTQLDLVFG